MPLVAVLAACATAPTPDAETAREGWAGHPQSAAVGELSGTYGIVAIASSAWQPGEVDALLAGARRLPARLKDALSARRDRPLFVVRRSQVCPYGLGVADSGPCRRLSDDARTLYLYDWRDGAARRDPSEAALDDRARRRLWRERAIVHLAVDRLDRDRGWSDQTGWRSINGWEADPDEPPLNAGSDGYARPLGQRSARLDLVTFAERYLVRPEATGSADDEPACTSYTKARFAADHLGAPDPDQARCPAFESWARLDELTGVDVLLAAATADRPESLYGHILLHLRYGPATADGQRLVTTDGFDPVYQFGAVVGTDVGPLDYLGSGLFGGFDSVLTTTTLRAIERSVGQFEQRDLRRYELRLTEVQRRRLLHRIWEVERQVRWPYYFLSHNCATYLELLLSPVVGGALGLADDALVFPTDVLDRLARLRGAGGRRLLAKRAAETPSRRKVARRALQAREDRLAALAAATGAGRRDADLHGVDAALADADAPARRALYGRLGEAVGQRLDRRWEALGGDQRAEAVRAAMAYLDGWAVVERHLTEQLQLERDLRRARKLAAVEPISADEQLARRQAILDERDAARRQELVHQWTGEQLSRLAETPVDDQTLAEALAAQRQTYLAVLDAQADLLDRFAPDFDGVAFDAAREHDAITAQRAIDTRARGASAKHRLFVGVVAPAYPSSAPSLELRAHWALVYDRLGEVRRRGFQPGVEAEVLGLRLRAPADETALEAASVDLVLFRYLTLAGHTGPLAEGAADALGWGADLRLLRDGARGDDLGVRANVGYVLPLVVADPAVSYVALGVFPELAGVAGDDARVLGGVRAGLRARLHLGGRWANALAVDADWGHHLAVGALDDPGRAWRHDGRAELGAELAAASIDGEPLVVTPYLEAAFRRAWPAAIAAGLRLDLPL